MELVGRSFFLSLEAWRRWVLDKLTDGVPPTTMAANDWIAASRELAGKMLDRVAAATATAAAAMPDPTATAAAAAIIPSAIWSWTGVALAFFLLFEVLPASAAAEELVLGERGAAGLAWAALTPAGMLAVVAAAAEASLPSAVVRRLGRRWRRRVSSRAAAAVGERLEVASKAPSPAWEDEVVGVCGWVREEVSLFP